MSCAAKRYYEVMMGAIRKSGLRPMVMMQVGDGCDAYVFNHNDMEWRYDPDMFARRVVGGDRLTRREIGEDEARSLIEGAGSRFDGAPLVKGRMGSR